MNPRRPRANSSATPPTTGGSTSGRVTRARSRLRPRNRARASTHANGTPRISEIAVAIVAVTSESRSAPNASDSSSSRGRSRQDARSSRPTSGSSRNATATTAGTARGHGAREVTSASDRVRRPPSGLGARGGTRTGEVTVTASRLLEARGAQHARAVSGQDVVDELLRHVGVLRRGQGGDRVARGGVHAGRDLDPGDLVACGEDVGHVDDASIDLADLAK